MTGKAADAPRDRRFAAPRMAGRPLLPRDPRFLSARVEAAARLVSVGERRRQSSRATVRFLLDQYLNAVAPTNFAHTNPEVIKRTKETNGANLVQGFAQPARGHRRAAKGSSSAAPIPTRSRRARPSPRRPAQVVFQNDLFQLIQYDPATDKVAAEPLLYVPPLVNRYYMIDLVPRQSLVKWLVDEGRTVFVISWVNPDREAQGQGRRRLCPRRRRRGDRAGRASAPARRPTCSPSASAARWSRSRWPGSRRRSAPSEVNSATLIGSMVDFADMRDWSAFVHEGHLAALEDHLEAQGYIDSVELQRLFAAMRANDLIWSSVVNHYLLDQPAPPSDLLYWFEDGARIPAAFLKSYNRELLLDNKLKDPAGFKVGGTADRPRRDRDADAGHRA